MAHLMLDQLTNGSPHQRQPNILCLMEIMEATTMLSKLENLSRHDFEDLCFWLGVPQASWPARLPPHERTHALIDWLTERGRLPELVEEMSYLEEGLHPWSSPSSPSNR